MSNPKEKHLDYIRSEISAYELRSYGFKKICLGIVIALFAFAGTNSDQIGPLAYVGVLTVWLLDMKAASYARRYQDLYNSVRTKPAGSIDYDMSLPKARADTCIFSGVFSLESIFYAVIFALVLMLPRVILG
ncbi:MAG: hypothetical protein Q7P63_03475 [Verrucomicrobiota bacterium JB022]|nr:hypothetical protein [Verrucomicrobiota bacterium JB022]